MFKIVVFFSISLTHQQNLAPTNHPVSIKPDTDLIEKNEALARHKTLLFTESFPENSNLFISHQVLFIRCRRIKEKPRLTTHCAR